MDLRIPTPSLSSVLAGFGSVGRSMAANAMRSASQDEAIMSRIASAMFDDDHLGVSHWGDATLSDRQTYLRRGRAALIAIAGIIAGE